MEPAEECLFCQRPISLVHGNGPDAFESEVAFVWLFKLDYNQCEYQSEHVFFNGREFSFAGRLQSSIRKMCIFLQCHNQAEQKEEVRFKVCLSNSSCYATKTIGPVWHGPKGFQRCTKDTVVITNHNGNILETDTSFIMPLDTKFRIRIKCTFSVYYFNRFASSSSSSD
jgi:hypothetical protein